MRLKSIHLDICDKGGYFMPNDTFACEGLAMMVRIIRNSLLFDEKRYKQIKEMCPVQKLSHKKHADGDVSGTFYDVLVDHGFDFFGINDVS